MDPTQAPHAPVDPDAVERSVELDLGLEDAVDALHRPDVLSTWLGRWTDRGPDGASVVTDDGVTRSVRDIVRRADGVSWSWSPSTGGPTSDVTIAVTPLEDGRSRVTVREVRAASDATAAAVTTSDVTASAGIALDGLGWAVCLLALEIAAAARALALVGAG
jgi:hypothetical protein